jgi:hypothetical protein
MSVLNGHYQQTAYFEQRFFRYVTTVYMAYSFTAKQLELNVIIPEEFVAELLSSVSSA